METPTIAYNEYWDGKKWIPAGGPFGNADIAWSALGGDNFNYRTIGWKGEVNYQNGGPVAAANAKQGEGNKHGC